MMVRVTVTDTTGDFTLARESFETPEEADVYWRSLLAEDSVLTSLAAEYDCVCVSRAELYKGVWVETCRKLVGLR